jgi:predicted dehydrogenase
MVEVAVIGAGHWGPNLIGNFHNMRASSVRWVVDRDEARLEAVLSRFPDVQVSTSAEEVLADERVGAAVIATPTSTHYPLVKAALEAGKHVLVEKPIATSTDEGRELCELASGAGRVLMVGHVFVHNAAVQQVRRYIEDGELGQIYYISMERTNLGPIRTDVNASWDLVSHDVSIANYWLEAEAVSATAFGGVWINAGIEDAVFATLEYPAGVLVHLHASWLHPRKSREITVVGSKRMLTFDDMNLIEPIRIYDKQVTEDRIHPGLVDSFGSFRASVREGDVRIPKVSIGEPLRAECNHFLECIESNSAPLTGGLEGVAVVRVLEAMERSMGDAGHRHRVEA